MMYLLVFQQYAQSGAASTNGSVITSHLQGPGAFYSFAGKKQKQSADVTGFGHALKYMRICTEL